MNRDLRWAVKYEHGGYLVLDTRESARNEKVFYPNSKVVRVEVRKVS